jgi:hypothetical protein
VQVIDSLDEMRLPDDDVSVLGLAISSETVPAVMSALPSEWIDHTNMLGLFPAAAGYNRGTVQEIAEEPRWAEFACRAQDPKVLP